MRTRAPCGTYSGYQRHGIRGEEHCEPCRAAAAEYRRMYRRSSAERMERDRKQRNAYARATSALIDQHRHEFTKIYNLERQKAGLP